VAHSTCTRAHGQPHTATLPYDVHTRAHTHTHTRARARACAPVHRYTRVRAGARARIRSRDGRSGTDARARRRRARCNGHRQLNGGRCMHLPKAVRDQGGARRRWRWRRRRRRQWRRREGAHYIAWRTLVPVLARRAGGQIFPAPLTALIAPDSHPGCTKLSNPDDGRSPASDRSDCCRASNSHTRGHTRHQNSPAPGGRGGGRGARRGGGETAGRKKSRRDERDSHIREIIADYRARFSRSETAAWTDRVVRVQENKRGRREAYVTR